MKLKPKTIRALAAHQATSEACIKALREEFPIGRKVKCRRGKGMVEGKIVETSIYSPTGRVRIMTAGGKRCWLYLAWLLNEAWPTK